MGEIQNENYVYGNENVFIVRTKKIRLRLQMISINLAKGDFLH